MYADYQSELDYIGQSAVDNVGDANWVKIRLVAQLVGNYLNIEAWYWPAGQVQPVAYCCDYEPENADDNGVLDVFENIKWEMYQLKPEEGTWLWATLDIDRAYEYTVEYDYDNQPEMGAGLINKGEALVDEDYEDEWEDYPRIRPYTPDWWLEILERNGIDVGDTLPESADDNALVPPSIPPGPEPPPSPQPTGMPAGIRKGWHLPNL